MLGSLRYMAPEQRWGKADDRSDLYSLGVTLFQLLTGTLPHRGDSMSALIRSIANDTAPDVRFIRRLQRDIAERGRSTENVINQYLETVRPMHKQFIEPTKRRADVILPHGANGPAIDIITTKL